MNREDQFQKVVSHLLDELKTIRTGRATPELVDGIKIESYGAQQPLKALASISTPDAKTVQIEPWDGSIVGEIERALMDADLGMMPNVDGKIIRLNMPMMTDDNRQQMVKKLKEKSEEAKVKIRRVREEEKKDIEKQDGIGDDDKRRDLENLETDVKNQISKIEIIVSNKEKEITTV